jgi:hypothetical protein
VPGKFVPELYEVLTMNAKVESEDSGSPPIRTITVYPTFAGGNVQNSEALQATVVDMVSFNEGDVALLKVEPPGAWPALEVVGEAPAAQTDILAAGYPGSVTNVTDFSLEPSFKDGKVSGTQEVQGVPFTQISAATTQGMSGGPTVDLDGRVVGVVSWGPTYEPQSFNFITETDVLRSLLSRNDALGELSATDTAYRAGLDAYAAGQYENAVEQFDAVLAAIPNHQLAQQYRQKALTAPSDSGSAGFPVIPVVVGGVIVTVLVAAAAVLLLRRRGGKAPAGEPAPVQPDGAAPRPTVAKAGPPTSWQELGVPPPQTSARPPTPRESAPYTPATATAVPPAGVSPPVPPGTMQFCPNCGKKHPLEAHFCDSCGQPFAAAVAPQGVAHTDQQRSS